MSSRIPLAAALALCAGLLSCNEYNFQGSRIEDIFFQEPASQVDILFVMDNSVSMEQEQNDVAENFEKFILNIEETNADWQIGIITTDMVDVTQRGRLQGEPAIIKPDTPDYQGAFATNIRVGTDGYPIERGLSAALAAVTAPLTTHENEGFIRQDATLAIIVVSDENDCSDNGVLIGDDQAACYQEADKLVPVPQFVTALRESKGEPTMVTFSAIVELESDSGYASCGEASTGHRYIKVANMLGGITRSICGEYDDVMDEMGLSVAGMRSSFLLSRTPDVCSITATIDNVEVPRDDTKINGWTYDLESNYILFFGTAVPPRASTITVTYSSGNGALDCEV
ncbi:MAG: VWA domain-containing protein [Myxococcota bacterium]|jgi:hypothetical protein|nr:VWA domain-containing protein [Myxococcota bacterium]